jgi:hypothetical protein
MKIKEKLYSNIKVVKKAGDVTLWCAFRQVDN